MYMTQKRIKYDPDKHPFKWKKRVVMRVKRANRRVKKQISPA